MSEASLGLIAMKVCIGFASLYIILIMTGRTSLSQLTPFHFVFILMLDDFLGHIIYENNVSVIKFLYAIGLWTVLMLILRITAQKSIKIRFMLQGKPAILIRNGIIDPEVVKKSKLDINQILSLLRQKSVFSVREVEFGILEPNGQISIAFKSKYQKPNMQDFHFTEKQVELPITLIMDGEIIMENLHETGHDEEWLLKELNTNGYKGLNNVFYADWKEDGGLYISPK
ncbi:DUF421 domain-containing protein [Bacillus testis]|uniref:DUF421 domain-containing protein n=1 Tax=Bacillus testis TaxID=1622072 RepID=UPI00067F019A|nr:DUF421 domain-containing protein [Bacillus testis]